MSVTVFLVDVVHFIQGAQAKVRGVLDLSKRAGVYLNGSTVYGENGELMHERCVQQDLVKAIMGPVALVPNTWVICFFVALNAQI